MKNEHLKTVPEAVEVTAAELVTQLVRVKLESRLEYLKHNANEDALEGEIGWEDESAQLIAELEYKINNHPHSPRSALIDVFGLSKGEIAMLDTCVAISADASLEDLVVQLQGRPYRPQITENLLKRLFRLSPKPIWHGASSLFRWKMVEPIVDPSGFAHSFRADPAMVNWYFGMATLDESITHACSAKDLSSDYFREYVSEYSQSILKMIKLGHSVRVVIQGSRGSGRKEFAANLSNLLGKRALCISPKSLSESNFTEDYIRIQRYCILTNRVPLWFSSLPLWPENIDSCPLQIVICNVQELPEAHAGYHDLIINQPRLSHGQKREIWQKNQSTPLPKELQSSSYRDLKLATSLVEFDNDELKELVSNQRQLSVLQELGQVIQPVMSWSDLVLSDSIMQQLKLFTKEIELRKVLLSDPETNRLYKHDTNSSALFSGPPGVGKTMAAQCVASDLGMPLVVIDVSKTINKYIGETAKNLSKIFEQAEKNNCLLFFDEADAFFSQRTELNDSHDRYANADTNHLLQLVENYSGPLILATNQRARIDAAFFRRIRNIVAFTNPDNEQRLELWRRLSGLLFSSKETESLSDSFLQYATKFELSPAQIKSSILNAKYLSLMNDELLSDQFIMHGIARELQKDGRSIPQSLKNNLEERPYVN